MRARVVLLAGALSALSCEVLAQDPLPPAAADRPADPSATGMQVKVFSIQRGDAVARAEMLQALLGQGTSLARSLRLTADPRTNSIIAVGNVPDLDVIYGILSQLDQPPATRSTSQPTTTPPSSPPPPIPTSAIQPPKTIVSPKATQPTAVEAETQRVERELNAAELALKGARSQVEQLEELQSKNAAAIVSTEVAKARLTVLSAEVHVEKLRQTLEERKHSRFPFILRSSGR
jgi:Bacterial type II/III secretion system short domain